MARSRVRLVRMARPQDGDSSVKAAVFALLGGLVLGYAGWSLQQRKHRQALFHTRPFRRLAALGYLRAHPSVDSARLLHEYLRWEPHPLLRRRARLVLRRMEHLLRS